MARHLDAEMSMDHSSGNQLYLPWKPLVGSHTAPRGHLCLPLLTEDSRLLSVNLMLSCSTHHVAAFCCFSHSELPRVESVL